MTDNAEFGKLIAERDRLLDALRSVRLHILDVHPGRYGATETIVRKTLAFYEAAWAGYRPGP